MPSTSRATAGRRSSPRAATSSTPAAGWASARTSCSPRARPASPGVDAFAGRDHRGPRAGRDGLSFQIGDLRDLPCEPGSFDSSCASKRSSTSTSRSACSTRSSACCAGAACSRSPRRWQAAIAVHNPHHVAERTPAELETLLRRRFANVELRWQHSALASLIDVGPADGRPAVPSPPLRLDGGPDRTAVRGRARERRGAPATRAGGDARRGLRTSARSSRMPTSWLDELSEARAEDRRAARARDARRGGLPRRSSSAMPTSRARRTPLRAVAAALELPAPLRAGARALARLRRRLQR